MSSTSYSERDVPTDVTTSISMYMVRDVNSQCVCTPQYIVWGKYILCSFVPSSLISCMNVNCYVHDC